MSTKSRTMHTIQHALTVVLWTCLLAVALCAASAMTQASSAVRAHAAPQFAPVVKDATANVANLALIVEFSDSPEESFYDKAYSTSRYATNLGYLMDVINVKGSSYMQRTYRDYLHTISKGRFDVATYFPQAYVDGTHLRIRVSMSSQNYSRLNDDSTLVKEAIAQLMSARPDLDASIFDVDGDGYIDNVLIIADLPQNIEITAHSNTDANSTVVGTGTASRKARALTALNGGGTNAGYDRFDPSVAVHERLHTIGAADLYRNSQYGTSGDPVKNWDVMASGGVFSWPLAFTRELVGWTKIPEVKVNSAGSSFTLYAPENSDDVLNSKPQAIKIKTSLSSSEYFIIEYRKKNSGLFAYDKYIGSSGLIVYRVNEQYASRGNLYGDDYVYVYRPGETSLTASAGDINRAAICAGGYTNQNGLTLNSSIGSLDMNASITDGAISYSNGLNSGLRITATSQTDSSITFKVEMSTDAAKNTWTPVTNTDGSSPFANLTSPLTKTVTDGKNLYALAESQGTGTSCWGVYKHDGTRWSQLGTNATNLAGLDIAWFNGSLYAIGSRTGASGTELKRFNGSSWITVATLSAGTRYDTPKLGVVGSKLYALISSSGKLTVHEFTGSSFKSYGSALPVATTANPAILNMGGAPAIVSGDTGQATWKTSLYYLANGAWSETLLLSNTAASIVSTATVNGKSYIYTHANQKAQLFEFDANGRLIKNSTIPQASDASTGGSLATDGTHLYLSIGAGSRGVIAYKLANGSPSSISQIEGIAYSSSFELHSCVIGSKLFVAIADPISGTVAVRSHAVEAASTPEPEPVKLDIARATVSSIPAQTYTGKAIMPSPTVTFNGKKLNAGTDYRLTYANNINIGTAHITITGIGNYAGTKTVTFAIVKTPTPTPDPTPTPTPDPTPTPTPTPDPTPTPTPEPSTPEAATTTMFRLYNPNSGEHFYTASAFERDHLASVGWNYEGVGWTAPETSGTPVYRLYNANAGDHHYTTSAVERDHLLSVGWNDEGIGWYSDDLQRVPLYRQYNPNAIAGSHNYTTSREETDMLISVGWHDEGIGWYGL